MGYSLVLVFIAICLILTLVITVKSQLGFLKNIILGLVSVFFTLLLAEIFFGFVPRTTNYGKSLSTKVWERYYWKNNADGFRDEDFAQKDSTKKRIAFIGDSFTAGQGIKNPADRYSDLIGAALKDSFEFYNVAISGTNSESKADILYSLQIKPDILIYEFFVDDIVDTRIRLDSVLPHSSPYKNLSPLAIDLIENSFLLNYLYWMYPHLTISDYKKYLTDSYTKPAITTAHEKVIRNIITYAKAHNIQLVFLTIPLPTEYEFSNLHTHAIEALVEDSGITNINITAALEPFPVEELIVNSSDMHLNEKGNQIIAKAILEKVFGIKQ